jgi:hypothetical protein
MGNEVNEIPERNKTGIRRYESHREIYMAAPSSATDTGLISLRDLIDFISHVGDAA